jgi:hypothetical protein
MADSTDNQVPHGAEEGAHETLNSTQASKLDLLLPHTVDEVAAMRGVSRSAVYECVHGPRFWPRGSVRESSWTLPQDQPAHARRATWTP